MQTVDSTLAEASTTRDADPVWYPLSSPQRDVWIDHNRFPDTPVYHVGGYLRIDGRLDPVLFRQALTLLVQENEVLRMVLARRDGVALQSFPDMPVVELLLHDCSGAIDPLGAARAHLQEAYVRPFRIYQEPLFRFTLYRLSENCQLWGHMYHHLVVDGWSFSLIEQRVAALYNALLRGEPLPANPGRPYTAFMADDAAYLGSDSFERHRQYWEKVFPALPEPLLLPRDGFEDPEEVVPGAVHTWFLPRARYARLAALAQAHSVSVFHALLGLLYVTFTQAQDRQGCVIGLPLLNRAPAFKQTIGHFVSMVPARFDFGRDLPFTGLIQAISRSLRESYRSQRYPLSGIHRLAGASQAGSARLFDLILSFETQEATVGFGDSGPCASVPLNHGFEQTPLIVYFMDHAEDQDVQIDFSYNLAYFDAPAIGRVRGMFLRLLDAVLAGPERPVRELDPFPPAERNRPLVDWNPDRDALPREAGVHGLFEDQTARTPEAVALIHGERTLTYAELNGRANRLAHRLRALGVKPGDRVAVRVPQGFERVIGLLAVLKAGAAYVPLEDGDPARAGGPVLLLSQDGPGPENGLPVLDPGQGFEEEPAGNPDPAGADGLACVVPVPGRPGFVPIEHRALILYLDEAMDACRLETGGFIPVHAASSFAMSVLGLFPHLLAGGAIELLPEAAEAPALGAILATGASLVKLTPACLDRLELWPGWSLGLFVRPRGALVSAFVKGEAEPLAEAERTLVVETWNATAEPYPSEACVHELFEAQAALTPEAVALVQGDLTLSYAELNLRANRLAHHLRALGVRPDRRVAICVPRSLEMVIGLLAALKAGGAYVPLDPAYPVERLAHMLADSEPVVLLASLALPDGLDRFLGGGLAILDPRLPLDGLPGTNPDPAAVGLTPRHLAYVIYTSGSTGQPKGVMIEHRGVCNLVQAQIRAFGVEPGSRVLQIASFSFDASVSEILMALCRGAALHLPAPGVCLAGGTLIRALERGRITHATLTPAVLAALPAHIQLGSVRTLVVAGDTVTEAVVRRWAPGRRLINAYGPTEATVCATLHECCAQGLGNPPIGRPMANTRIYILDGQGRPVATGVTGELHIGGVGVARGYLNRPELTAERFPADPFSPTPHARMYRTGDLGRWLPDGTIEFLGRNDLQVKVRGFRIELGEIEARLLEHPAIREAVVVARRDDRRREKRLVAYLTSDFLLEADTLRTHLADRLPSYMFPTAFVRMEALPLTPNGKLDRRALPAPGDEYQSAVNAPAG
jgi:amino acid adenylation domain-containing protein